MSSIDELRRTLERHADDLHDAARVERPAAVRTRVRTTRRRRAAAVATGAAVTLVAVTGAVGMTRDPGVPEPAAPVVPDRVEVATFPYRLVDTVPVREDGSVELPASEESRVVVLATSDLGDGVATLWVEDARAVARVVGDEHVSAPASAAGGLSVELDGAPDDARVELGVYEPTGELPAGVASGDVVFRDRLGDRELVAAAYGDARSPARIEVPGPKDDIEVSAWCRTKEDLYLHVEGGGGGWTCGWLDDTNDPGAANTGYFGFGPGEDTLTAYVTDGRNGPRVTDGEVAFGIAAYRVAAPPTDVLGADVPTVTELEGRTWRLDEVVEPEDGRYEVDTSGSDVLFGVVTAEASGLDLAWRGAHDRSSSGWSGGEPSGAGWSMGGVLWHGDRYVVDVDVAGAAGRSRLVLYRPE